MGGEGGIRTLEGLAPLAVFKTAAFNHSATSPGPSIGKGAPGSRKPNPSKSQPTRRYAPAAATPPERRALWLLFTNLPGRRPGPQASRNVADGTITNIMGGWGGWASSALPERQTMYQLSKLTRMPMVAGDAVHQSLARYLRLRPGHNADESEITDYAVEILRRKFRESRDKEWRRSASKYAHLAEHYYEEPMMQDLPAVAEYGKSFVDRIRTCVPWVFYGTGARPGPAMLNQNPMYL